MSDAQYMEKVLHVGKTDRYGINKDVWLAGEAITLLNVTADALVTVDSFSFVGGDITALLTGVSSGVSKVHFEYTTATRSDCQTILVRVKVC